METIGIAVAEGMRKGILAQREREGLTGPHPYAALDMAREEDRRIIASVYRSMAVCGSAGSVDVCGLGAGR